MSATSFITGGMVILVRMARIRVCSGLPTSSTVGPNIVSRPAR